MVTIRTIAEHCGLSVAAVSRALNGRSGISEERAEQVRRIAQELGYQPNEAARTLKTNRSNLIGVLYNNLLAHEFFAQVLEGLRSEAEAAGYEILFLNMRAGDYCDRARKHHCAGVIVAQGEFEMAGVEELIRSDIPTVGIELEASGCTTVFSDNVGAMEELVRYLHGLGHERIAFIHGEMGMITQERIAGFYRGCRSCGIQVPAEYLRQGKFRTPELADQLTRELLALPNPPTCILYPDDICYLGGAHAAEQLGLSIPEDLSCVGFDGVSITQALKPRLTSYFQDGLAMGRTAAQEVISAIEDPCCCVARTIFVAGHIQPGETVRDLRGGQA